MESPLKTEQNRLGRFPEAASEDLVAGPKRNFQVFDPLDFLAEVTQHIPDTGEHLIRYYGFYSNKSRGLPAKSQGQAGAAAPDPASAPSAKEARQRWAALIKQVYEVDRCSAPSAAGDEDYQLHRKASARGDREDFSGTAASGKKPRPARHRCRNWCLAEEGFGQR